MSAREVERGNVEEGIRLARQAVEDAEGVDVLRHAMSLGDLGETLVQAGMYDEARAVMVEAVDEARRNGLQVNVIWGSAQLGILDLVEGDYESSCRALTAARANAPNVGVYSFEAETLFGLGFAQLGLGERALMRGPPSPSCSSWHLDPVELFAQRSRLRYPALRSRSSRPTSGKAPACEEQSPRTA